MAARTPPTNLEVAARLEQLAVLLREEGADRYKTRAYRNAAAALRTFPASVAAMVAAGEDLRAIPGVGKSIAGAIREIIETGTLATAEKLSGAAPRAAVELAAAAGIPVREARKLVESLNVSSIEELREAVEAGNAPELPTRVAFALRRWFHGAQEVLWADAEDLVPQFANVIKDALATDLIEPAGEFRRGCEVVGALAYVALADNPDTAAERLSAALSAHAGLTAVHRRAHTITARTGAGPLLRVRVSDKHSWGDALVEETGSDAHLAEVRQLAKRTTKPAATEEDWYKLRALSFIPPELREGRGEVRAALGGALPTLLTLDDIRGDLHSHTTASDGVNTLPEMVRAARARGYSYLAVTDHSKSLRITRGLDEKRLRDQGRQIDAYNKRLKDFRVLKGSEVDILADGSLDFGDDTLATLDIVIASIHSRFGLNKEQQTQRLLRAIANPHLTCLGHMTGRLLLKRPGYEIDVDAVLDAVQRHHKMLEINSSPDRLDIDDTLARRAKDMGIPILINTDAHSTREVDFMRYGVQQARRAWLEPADVVNTQSLTALLRAIRKTRP